MVSLLLLYWLADAGLVVFLHSARGPLRCVLPDQTKELYTYGKHLVAAEKRSFKGLLHVSKRYFTLFYALGMVWAVISLSYGLASAVSGSLPFQEGVLSWIRWLARDEFTLYLPKLDTLDVFVTLSLLFVQVCRRFYECLFVLVQSPSAIIHMLHFVYGLTFYFFVALAPYSQAHFIGDSMVFNLSASLSAGRISRQIICIGVFLWGSYHQHQCHIILGNLRKEKNPRGQRRLTKTDYGMPCGGWFEYVSSPHYLAETIIYTAMAFCLGGVCLSWWLIVFGTFGNLVLVSFETHAWYKKRFEDYPKERTAFLPYLL